MELFAELEAGEDDVCTVESVDVADGCAVVDCAREAEVDTDEEIVDGFEDVDVEVDVRANAIPIVVSTTY